MEDEPLDETLQGIGVRLDWWELPESVRRGIEKLVGSQVVQADPQRGGFSPGVAARVRLASGARLFVKVVGESLNPASPRLYRREREVAERLPDWVPAPRLLHAYDEAGWVALVFEDVGARTPRLPWRRDELGRIVEAVAGLSSVLTPSPLALRTLASDADGFAGFRDLTATAAEGSLDDLDPWVVRHLERLADVHAGWAEATTGNTLLHLDLRADNILVADDRVLFVDWPHATVGAPWIDLLFMLPSVAMQGGPPPWKVFDASPLAAAAEADAVTVALAGTAGMLTAYGRRPDPPGLPTLRRFQRAQAAECVRWLRRRTGWR